MNTISFGIQLPTFYKPIEGYIPDAKTTPHLTNDLHTIFMCRLVPLDYNVVKTVTLPLWPTVTMSQNLLFIILTYVNAFRFNKWR